MKVWVIADKPHEDWIADSRYFEEEGDALDKCQELNNFLLLHGSRQAYEVYEAEITMVKPSP